MENSTAPFWKLNIDHSHFLLKISSDWHISTKQFTLNESAFSKWKTIQLKNSGQLYSKWQVRKSSNCLTGRLTSNHITVVRYIKQLSVLWLSQVSHPLSVFHSWSVISVPSTHPFCHQTIKHWKTFKMNNTKLRKSEGGLTGRSISVIVTKIQYF